MISFITAMFSPVLQLLQDAINALNNLSTVSAEGINISDYFSWLGVLDPAYQGVADSLLAGLSFVGILYITRAIYRFYLSLKEGIQWW